MVPSWQNPDQLTSFVCGDGSVPELDMATAIQVYDHSKALLNDMLSKGGVCDANLYLNKVVIQNP